MQKSCKEFLPTGRLPIYFNWVECGKYRLSVVVWASSNKGKFRLLSSIQKTCYIEGPFLAITNMNSDNSFFFTSKISKWKGGQFQIYITKEWSIIPYRFKRWRCVVLAKEWPFGVKYRLHAHPPIVVAMPSWCNFVIHGKFLWMWMKTQKKKRARCIHCYGLMIVLLIVIVIEWISL